MADFLVAVVGGLIRTKPFECCCCLTVRLEWIAQHCKLSLDMEKLDKLQVGGKSTHELLGIILCGLHPWVVFGKPSFSNSQCIVSFRQSDCRMCCIHTWHTFTLSSTFVAPYFYLKQHIKHFISVYIGGSVLSCHLWMHKQVCCRLFGVAMYVKCRCVCRFCYFGYNGKKTDDTGRRPVIRTKLNKWHVCSGSHL